MILRNYSFFLILGLFGFSSCLKEEIAVPKHQQGDELTNVIGMEEDYRNQLYFDLESNTIVSSNLKTAWDIAFESNGKHIVLNTGKGMAVHRSSLAFETITSESDLEWRWDTHTGNLDSTGFGNWVDADLVFIIDAGYDYSADHLGYYKVEIISHNASSITFNYGDISATSPKTISVEFSITEQFTYFSFVEETRVQIAPADTEYDLIFTQYTHLYTEPEMPYLVSGVVLNRNFTAAQLFMEKSFEEITINDAENLPLSYNLDAIGFLWKGYSLDEGIYTTYPEMNFIIKTQEEKLYKLHFTSFYSVEGIKGFPNIEFQEL